MNIMSNDNNNEFREIKGKKKIRKKILYKTQKENSNVLQNEEISLELFTKRLSKINLEIKSSSFLRKNLEILSSAINSKQIENIDKIICLGVGPFTRNINSLHQLAFFLNLSKLLNITDIEFYDPVFSTTEEKLLKSQNVQVTCENNEGCYSIKKNTLICLPHCPTELTNNILWANWNPTNLNKIILLCTSIDDTLTKNSQTTIDVNFKLLKCIAPYVKEIQLVNNYNFEDIFNDMTLHVFDLPSTIVSDEKFWHKDEKPTKISEEMVTNEIGMLNLN